MAGEMGQLAETPLGQAIMQGDAKRIRKLIEEGENPRFIDRKGNTYLHFVSTTYRPYVFHVMAASGLEINAQNRDGNTALHVTALHNECCHVSDLMAIGVDPFLKNKRGKTAADIAEKKKLWLDLYRKYEPGLRNAIKEHDIEKITYLMRDAWSAVHIVSNGKDVRQYAAGLTFHDIVAMVDKSRFSLMAVYAVLERNYKDLKYALSRGSECNVNMLHLLKGSHPHHILQHAIRQSEYKMVKMLLDAGAEVNTTVHVNEYIRGPLYFEAILFDPEFDPRIRQLILESEIDLTARDERGRSALMYAIDRRNGDVTGDVTLEVIHFLLDGGIDIAMRDNTGCTARDVARFARRRDIVKALDKHVVNMIKRSDIPAVRSLAMKQYEQIQLEFNYRDTWIYAAGNETSDMADFLESLKVYKVLTKSLFRAIEEGDIMAMTTVLTEFPDKHMLLHAKDKHGRGTLLKSVTHEHYDITSKLLEEDPSLLVTDKDNCNKTALHYAWSIQSKDNRQQFLNLLGHSGSSHQHVDTLGNKPEDMCTCGVTFLGQQKAKTYALELELYCLEKYEKLLKVIRSKQKGLKEFDVILKDLKYPVATFTALFHPDGSPLVCNYRDLLLAAIDHDKEDIARKLVRCGVDCSWREQYSPSEKGWMNAQERAKYLEKTDLADYIELKGKTSTRTG